MVLSCIFNEDLHNITRNLRGKYKSTRLSHICKIKDMSYLKNGIEDIKNY